MKAMLTKVLAALLVVTITAGIAITGTLAFLTDRDSEANVFTVGDVAIDLEEDFDQGATLIPGVDIEKKPTITNTGKNDAWVWAEIAIPAAFDNEDASKNVVHFNFSKESVAAGLWNWKGNGDWLMRTETIDGIEYNVYTVLYDTILKPGETTAEPVMTKVYMDPHVDIDPNGDWYHVEGGVVEGPYWNSEKDGNPVIYVSAYAMQADGFNTALDAYNAYTKQWTTDADVNNGLEWAGVTQVASNADLDKAIKDGATNIVLGDGTYIIPDSAKGKTLNIIGSGDTVIVAENDGAGEGNGDYSFDGATVTFQNVTINTTGTYFPGYPRMKGTFINCTINGVYTLYDSSSFENCTFNVTGDNYNVWTWGAAVATFDSCTFNCDGKAVLLYGTANTKLTMNNCVFNDNGDDTVTGKTAIEIGNDYGKSYELIVNNATVKGFAENPNGIATGTTLWSNKNSMGTDKLNVVIDGVDVH